MDTVKHTDPIEELLEAHGIRPTAVRILICRAISAFHDTFSINDVEAALESVDRSTVFRTLTNFAEHHLVHEIEDGSGQKKYCFCHNDHKCTPEEMHCHFYCTSCHKTFCLDNTAIPVVEYPPGFRLDSVEYLMRGICAKCKGG